MTQIRKFIPILSDYRQTVEIDKALFPEEDITIDDWKWHDQHHPPTAVFSRWVGEVDGKIISHGLITQDESADNNNRYKLHISVHPDFQGKGYGSELFQHLQRMLHPYLPCTIEATIRAGHPYACEFLNHRHFAPLSQLTFLRLNLPDHPAPLNLEAANNKIKKLGITIYSLKDFMAQTNDWKMLLYKLERKLVADVPAISIHFPHSLALYEENYLLQPWFNPESVFIASYQQHLIGISGIFQSLQKHNCYRHGFTGVEKPYRRNGLASLLILNCIQYAVNHNIAHLESEVIAGNPIQKVYENLGYKHQPLIVYESHVQ